jgi:hypothetical protein
MSGGTTAILEQLRALAAAHREQNIAAAADADRMLEAERRARARADERHARRVELWVDAGFVIMLAIGLVCAIVAL